MIEPNKLRSPSEFLRYMLGTFSHEPALRSYNSSWETDDHSSMYDRAGHRLGQILYKGYVFTNALFDFIPCYYDQGLTSSYVVSLASGVPIQQHAAANIATVAQRDGDRWLLVGDRYFASNAGEELVLVAARPVGAPRNIAHWAKYWMSDVAPEIASWSMELHGAFGVLAEFPVERWLREAIVLTIREGTCHRQILDGIEVMERKRAHHLLFEHVREAADSVSLERMRRRLDAHLALPPAQREAAAEELFRDRAAFTGRVLRSKLHQRTFEQMPQA